MYNSKIGGGILFGLFGKEVRGVEEEEDVVALAGGFGYSQINKLTKEQALSLPPVASAVEFIASTIAGLPIKLYRKGTVDEVTDDYRLRLLNLDSGDLLTATQMKSAFIYDYLLDGNGYIYLNKSGNKIKSLHYINSSTVGVIMGTDPIVKGCSVMIQGRTFDQYNFMRLTRNSKNGMLGRGILSDNCTILDTLLGSFKYENSTIKSGTKRGFLKSEQKLSKKMMNMVNDAWHKYTSGQSNEVMVLNKGISFEPSGSSAVENELDASKSTNAKMIYSWFNLSTDFLTGNTETYINNVKTAIIPILNNFNNMLNTFLLLENEKDSLFFAVDCTELLKSTIVDRYDSYVKAIDGGFLQVDEVRKIENMPPLGLDFVKLGLGDVLYNPKTKQVFTPNTGTTQQIDT